jgi:hypothetical protein
MGIYIVVTESQYSHEATLAKLNYSGERYEVIAKGKYSDIVDLAKTLNANDHAATMKKAFA